MHYLCFTLTGLVASLLIASWGQAASVSKNLDITVTNGSPFRGSPYRQWSNGPSTSANFFPIEGMASEPEPHRRVQGNRNQHVRRLLG
jgi:hypothetical protein